MTRLLLCALCLAFASPAFGLSLIESGWYREDGVAVPDGYYTVGYTSGFEHRNWFVIDLQGIAEPITSATLTLRSPDHAAVGGDGYQSPDPTETLTLFAVDADPLDVAARLASVPIFGDLGDGTILGSVTLSPAINGANVAITFNAAGISALNAALGGYFAVGGAITTISGTDPQYAFGNTGENGFKWFDWCTAGECDSYAVAPEPGTSVLVAAGVAVLAAWRRRR